MKKTNPTILAVDDDPHGLFFLLEAFKAAGIAAKIQTADSGYAAIAYIMGEGKYADRTLFGFPDFVITDLKMPGIDGFGVLEFFKKNRASATIPVAMLSGSQDNDDIRKSYLLGASSYHLKPGAPSELRALAKALFDYWTRCEIPDVDHDGNMVETESSHKLGERFSSLASHETPKWGDTGSPNRSR